ncbi:hypothetical protein DXG01_012543 [Tephrocybe rancida]|nr:hypothetical protein DXG01_012543 [Tephrocybe rancida]
MAFISPSPPSDGSDSSTHRPPGVICVRGPQPTLLLALHPQSPIRPASSLIPLASGNYHADLGTRANEIWARIVSFPTAIALASDNYQADLYTPANEIRETPFSPGDESYKAGHPTPVLSSLGGRVRLPKQPLSHIHNVPPGRSYHSLLTIASAQQIDTLTAETHPKLPRYKSTKSDGCASQSTGAVTLDANWRWTHITSGSSNYYAGQTWDKTLCPDGTTCAINCALDGADYSGVYSITTSGDTLTLNCVTRGANTNVGSLRASTSSSSTFDVEVSDLPCGLTSALYFLEMDADGRFAKHSTNKAGAKYGLANSVAGNGSSAGSNSGTNNYGACCNEMDIWLPTLPIPALSPASTTALTPSAVPPTATAPSAIPTVATSTPTAKIHRLYVQNGAAIQNSKPIIPGLDSYESITGAYCDAQKTAFGDTKQFQAKAKADKNGTVLVLSVWDDHAVDMLWLDSTYPTDASASTPGVGRGTCATSSGTPHRRQD